MTTMPEPPDGIRIEVIHHTDRYAAWRDDASSAEAGWTSGDGGEVWCVYPNCVPQTWASLVAEFGDSLLDAVWLVPIEAQPARFPHGFVASDRADRCRVCGDAADHRRHKVGVAA